MNHIYFNEHNLYILSMILFKVDTRALIKTLYNVTMRAMTNDIENGRRMHKKNV